MNTFSKKLYNSVEFKTVFQLKLMCKELGIRGYSGKRKLWIQNKIKTHLNKQQQTEVEKAKGLFCYPEIIQTIYQYHTVDDVDLKRKNILNNAKKEEKRTRELMEQYKYLHKRLRNKELKKYNYRNFRHLNDVNHDFWILSRKDFNKMYVRELKIWLKRLGYKPKGGISKLRKKQLYEMVVKYNEELNLL
ncbi:uncharacterized protein METZ01_LOCUS3772 [marine metagenome]|uniref:Uncharacterized protein n=1 Tax=marine metagenome TaxID=408172 RepID=A0A381NB07_9ZZZZ